jgi:RNA polymerase sigma factor (sigma-70 family)
MPSNEDAGPSCVSAFLAASPTLRRLVSGMGFSAADADDILQEVYLEASQRPGEYRGPQEAQRWLLRVTVNRCLLEYRRRRRFQRAAQKVLERQREQSGSRAEPPMRIEEVEAVRGALQKLDGQSSAILSRPHTARLKLADVLRRRGTRP